MSQLLSGDQAVPEDRVATILARAAELDRTATPTVGTEAIRTAAIEAGISASAVDRALEEYASSSLPALPLAAPEEQPEGNQPKWRRWVSRVKRPLTLGLLSLVSGALIGGAEEIGVVLAFVAFPAALFYLTREVIRRRQTRAAKGFVAALLAITLGAFFGVALVNGDEDLMASILVAGLMLLPVGVLGIKVRRRRKAPPATELSGATN